MMSDQRPASPTVPTGTVTFLFTDVEGSTRLWHAEHDAMRSALARHDALLRECIEAHGGYVFKTVGDAFCAAFATASDALEAALAAQLALLSERWPENASIRVRMALHTGSAEARGGDYFGPPLNQVARVLAVGHGGQTLVSEITRDLCRDRLPAGATLKSLGEHALKDLSRRETLFQLCHPGVPQAFPPLKTMLSPVDPNTPSIAVLPFTDLSPTRDQEYFTDGLAEELLNVLTKIPGLRVASRTSAFSFKGKDVDVPTIAQKLNVATVLEGSVRKAGTRVRVTAQLIQVATDSHLWSHSYDRELEDIFAVQDDIAQSVVKELRSALLGEKTSASARAEIVAEVQAATRGRGENAEAYGCYLQGRFFEDRMTPEDTEHAVDHYRQALDLDPEYALAWAGLARCYVTQTGTSWVPSAEGRTKAQDAAEQALRFGPELPEAHAARGEFLMFLEWDWHAADASFHRALEIAPGNARIMRSIAILAGFLGRIDEGIAMSRRAAALDPLAIPLHRTHARLCYCAGSFDEAEAAIRKTLELNPLAGRARYILGLVRLQQGRGEEALAEFEQSRQSEFCLLGRALAHKLCGADDRSVAALHELIDAQSEGAAYQIAEAYAYRGETESAFEWLERAYAQRDAGLGMTKTDPLLRSLHADARWQPFLRKMKLAD